MLTAAPIDPASPDVRYGTGVAIHQGGSFGPVYGHGGWIPGYTSSLRYYADDGVAIAFQINTDSGIGGSAGMDYVGEMERRLAEMVAGASGR